MPCNSLIFLDHAFPLLMIIKQKKKTKTITLQYCIPALFQALIVAVSRGNCFWPPRRDVSHQG